jgi:hypothetical protein
MSKKLEQQIEELKARIAALEGNQKEKVSELPFWMPKPGETYFYMDEEGNPESCTYESDEFDEQRIAIGNYAETEEILQKRKAKLKLLEEIKQWRGKYDPESFKLSTGDEGNRIELMFDTQADEWDWIDTCEYKRPLSIFFSTADIALECIEHFGDRLDLLLEGDGE